MCIQYVYIYSTYIDGQKIDTFELAILKFYIKKKLTRVKHYPSIDVVFVIYYLNLFFFTF